MKTILVFLGLAVAALSAQSDDRWMLISQTKTTRAYLDTNTVKWQKGDSDDSVYVTLWVKYVDAGGSAMQRTQLHNTTRRFRVLSYAEYAASGELKESNATAGQWIDVVPESVADRIYQIMFVELPAYARQHPTAEKY